MLEILSVVHSPLPVILRILNNRLPPNKMYHFNADISVRDLHRRKRTPFGAARIPIAIIEKRGVYRRQICPELFSGQHFGGLVFASSRRLLPGERVPMIRVLESDETTKGGAMSAGKKERLNSIFAQSRTRLSMKLSTCSLSVDI